MTEDLSRSAENDEQDKIYFEQVFKLERANKSRYESEARKLLANKIMTIAVRDTLVRYKLGLFGCGCEISLDQGKSFRHASWIRMGWRKSSKLESLPLLFATTEAELLMQV